MITMSEVWTGLFAAWRMFLRDSRAVALFDDSVPGVFKSFFCAAVVLPGYILILALGPGPIPAEVSGFRLVTVEAIAYVISWTAWPLLMASVAKALDKDANYCRYVVAYNWSAGPQILILLAVMLVSASGIVSRDVLVLINLAALAVVLLYHLFILRIALEVSPYVAVALVIGEFMLSQFIIVARNGMLI